MSNKQRFTCYFAALVLILPCAGAPKRLKIYSWQGAGTGSNLANPRFVSGWNGVLNNKQNNVIIALKPPAAEILAGIADADIIFASTHSGIPKGAAEQGLQVLPDGVPNNVLRASEIAALNITRPKLIVINGCATFPLLPEPAGAKRNIASAFGIPPGRRPGSGRAYMGFKDIHGGAKGDNFFRIFFYLWTGGGGEQGLTITDAARKAKAYIEAKVSGMGGDDAQTLFLSNAAASVYKDLEIIGDDTLRYSDLLR